MAIKMINKAMVLGVFASLLILLAAPALASSDSDDCGTPGGGTPTPPIEYLVSPL